MQACRRTCVGLNPAMRLAAGGSAETPETRRLREGFRFAHFTNFGRLADDAKLRFSGNGNPVRVEMFPVTTSPRPFVPY